MHPPASHRCQIYSEVTSVRCINDGNHWVPWGRCQHTDGNHGGGGFCEADFYSWECDGPHRFGEAA
jgi:hypothetical protein